MKRIIAIAASLIMLLSFGTAFADGLSDPLPPVVPVSVFEDLGETRAVLVDIDSSAILFSRNSDKQAKPGSLTALMTALLLMENTAPADWNVFLPALKEVNSSWSGRGNQMGLEKGDTPSRADLLYGLLLEGAADAAYTTAVLVSGSESEFVSAMNVRAQELGMTGTKFDNGYGLGSGGHYTCAYDLTLLLMECMKHPEFEEAVRCENYTCSAGSRGITLINTNPELSQPGCIGIKSGADSEKEHSVITAYVEGTARLAAIILEAPSESAAYSIAFRLITEGFSRYISEGGLRSFTPTDALFVSKGSARLLDRPGGAADIVLKEGETLRVCGSSREGGSVWYCVYLRGSCFWVSSSEVDFVCYVDDIFIENGESLSCEMDKGGNIEIASYASSRHLINSVRLTVSLPDGSVALTSEHFPNTRGVCRLDGTSFSAPFEASASLREGVYLCTIEVTATAYADGLEPQSIIKTNSSILAVETGGECVSYNANVGVDQPEGECFFDKFTVTSDTPSRAGYKFICWNTQPDGSGENYFPGSEIASDGSLTLYAVWEKGPDRWEVNARILYEDSLIVEGFVRDLAGITGLRMRITGKDGTICDEAVDYYGNTAELGSLFIKEPIYLEEGEYTVEILGSAAGGAEVDLISQEITVNDPGSGPHEDPSESAAPDENASQAPGSGFSLLNIPIWVWFIVGAVVFFGLIALIIIIIKRG